MRVADEMRQPEQVPYSPPPIQPSYSDESGSHYGIDFFDDYQNVINEALEQKSSSTIEDMIVQAVTQSQEYDHDIEESVTLGDFGSMEGALKNNFKMNSVYQSDATQLRIPMFYYLSKPDWAHSQNYIKLNKELLSKGFSLMNADSNVNFTLAESNIYSVDVFDTGNKYHRMTALESQYIRTTLDHSTNENKIKVCTGLISKQLEFCSFGNMIPSSEISYYVERIISNLNIDDLTVSSSSYQFYANRIQKKIETLLAEYRESHFYDLLESGKIFCRPMFILPTIITPTDTLDGLEKSLYESEAAVNSIERKVIEEITALPNVRWWHRIAENKKYSFNINAFINHYPDFIVMTESQKLLVVEVKGDDRDNSDSERKLRLGRHWQNSSGDRYRYYMVFDRLNWKHEGAFDISRFISIIKEL
jgi:type III restriction enzyme